MTHRFKYLITGCSHSGTGCVSKALTSVGVICTHEGVRNGKFEVAHGAGSHSTADVVADSNHYMSRPGGIELAFFDQATIIHLVRDPILVIRSWCDVGMPDDVPAALDEKARQWVTTNIRVEAVKESKPYRFYRIEDGYAPLMRFVGKEGTVPPFWDAHYNKHYTGRFKLEWKDMPDTVAVEALRAMAARYGYSVG